MALMNNFKLFLTKTKVFKIKNKQKLEFLRSAIWRKTFHFKLGVKFQLKEKVIAKFSKKM